LLDRKGLDGEIAALGSEDKAAARDALRDARDTLELLMSALGA